MRNISKFHIKRCIFTLLIVFFVLISCSGRLNWSKYTQNAPLMIPDEIIYYKEYSGDVDIVSMYPEDVYEYVYESKVEGFIEYRDKYRGILRSSAVSIMVEKAVSYGQEKLMLYIDFEKLAFTLALWLVYDESANIWRLSNYEDKELYSFANLNSEYDEFFTMPETRFKLDIDNYEDGVIKNISLKSSPDKGFDGWNGFEEHIRYFEISIKLRLSGYITEGDYQSNFNVNKIRYKNTYRKVNSVPNRVLDKVFTEPETYLDELVNYLVGDVYDVFEKVKIINEWIAENIYYDVSAVMEKRFVNPSPTQTLEQRKSDSSGFAHLFSKMCETAGINVATIFGRVKGYLYRTTGEVGYHTWNAVRVNDRWYIIDVALNCGNYADYGGRFVKKPYTTKYLLLEPKYAIYTHLPDKKLHQFLTRPISEDRFYELPKSLNVSHLTSLGYEHGVAFQSKVETLMQADGKPFAIKLSCPSTITQIKLKLVNRQGEVLTRYSLSEKADGGFILRYHLPRGEFNCGIWLLDGNTWIYAGDIASQNQLDTYFQTLPNLKVEAPFPLVNDDFYNYNIDFLSSNIGDVEISGGIFRFDIKSDERIKAVLASSLDNTSYEQSVLRHKKNDVYTYYVSPPGLGEYKLNLFVLDRGDEVFIGDLVLSSNSGSETYSTFPKQHRDFTSHNVYLYSPITYTIEIDKVYGFVISMPDVELVYLSVTGNEDGKHIIRYLDKINEGECIFATEYRIEQGEKLNLMFKTHTEDEPKCLLTYDLVRSDDGELE